MELRSVVNHPNELILENFRCFRTEQRGRLRPITLLVGENSTGKSSFLASYMAIVDCISGQFMNNPDFNFDPFELGSFNDILHSSDDERYRANKFKIGLGVSNQNTDIARLGDLYVTIGQNNGLPQVHSLRREFRENVFIELRQMASGTKISIPEYSRTLKTSVFEMCRIVERIASDLARAKIKDRRDKIWYSGSWLEPDHSEQWRDTVDKIFDFLAPIINGRNGRRLHVPIFDPFRFRSVRQYTNKIIPIAPIRSKPKRTYDPLRGNPSPEGEHIPLLLRQLEKSDKNNWKIIRKGLIAFGELADLFSDIRIKNYVKESNSPFQVQVKVSSGGFVNIMDVGYGVSQCLPVVANILADRVNGRGRNSTFLLQQPEVHLHPRAQAALANVICDAVAQDGSRFIIETHSDYIINRIRILIMNNAVDASAISLIYFERDGSAVQLYNIGLDGDGNLTDCPSSYRTFFLEETDRLLGFID